jgi:hypothetical protein
MIADLLETIIFEPATPMEVRLAIYESRDGLVEALRKIINFVETTKHSKEAKEPPSDSQDTEGGSGVSA